MENDNRSALLENTRCGVSINNDVREVMYAGSPGYSEVVITAGGTREAIDDVRFIGNFSAGRLGIALATEYSEHGHQVTLIAPNETIERFGIPDSVRHMPFTNTESLKNQILGIKIADLVLHAAAVSDYRPYQFDGKISSNQEKLTVTMEKTPKILPLLRGHFGEKTTIAGFKLLSKVSMDHLIEVSRLQIEDCDTDYSIANLLDDITTDNKRTLYIVGDGNSVNKATGSNQEVAKAIHRQVKWSSRNETFSS